MAGEHVAAGRDGHVAHAVRDLRDLAVEHGRLEPESVGVGGGPPGGGVADQLVGQPAACCRRRWSASVTRSTDPTASRWRPPRGFRRRRAGAGAEEAGALGHRHADPGVEVEPGPRRAVSGETNPSAGMLMLATPCRPRTTPFVRPWPRSRTRWGRGGPRRWRTSSCCCGCGRRPPRRRACWCLPRSRGRHRRAWLGRLRAAATTARAGYCRVSLFMVFLSESRLAAGLVWTSCSCGFRGHPRRLCGFSATETTAASCETGPAASPRVPRGVLELGQRPVRRRPQDDQPEQGVHRRQRELDPALPGVNPGRYIAYTADWVMAQTPTRGRRTEHRVVVPDGEGQQRRDDERPQEAEHQRKQ